MPACGGRLPDTSAAAGDNDSMLRLVEIRDLIGGQGWFDLHQYRMGPQGGFVMHWSRLVDAPIAAIILVVSAFTGKLATGETAALLAWPTLLMAAALAFTLRIARAVGGDWALLPALIICTAALLFGGPFAPGNIDHHNVQLTLTLAAMTALIIGRSHVAGIAAGAACALMLAVGMETLPYVAVAGLTVSAGYLLGGRAEAAKAAGFGIGFAGVGFAAFLATVPASAWLASQCDAYSLPQFSVAMLSGLGLAAAAVSPAPGRSFVGRLAALLALGVAVAVLAVTAFPQCLADPMAGMDPRVQQYFLDNVIEGRSFWNLLTHNWVMAVRYYVTPALALIVLGIRLRKGSTAAEWTLTAFLIAAFAVSVWLVRGATFSVPLAAIALAAWVGVWRQRIRVTSDRSSMLRMAVAWLVSLNFAWGVAAYAASAALGERDAAPAAKSANVRTPCRLRPARCAASNHGACHLQPRLADPCPHRPPRAGRALSPQHHRQPAHTRRVHGNCRAGADRDRRQPDRPCRHMPRQRRDASADRTGARWLPCRVDPQRCAELA